MDIDDRNYRYILEKNEVDCELEYFWFCFKGIYSRFAKTAHLNSVQKRSKQLNDFQRSLDYYAIEDEIEEAVMMISWATIAENDPHSAAIMRTNIARWEKAVVRARLRHRPGDRYEGYFNSVEPLIRLFSRRKNPDVRLNRILTDYAIDLCYHELADTRKFIREMVDLIVETQNGNYLDALIRGDYDLDDYLTEIPSKHRRAKGKTLLRYLKI